MMRKLLICMLLMAAMLLVAASAEENAMTVLMYVSGDDLESEDGFAQEDFEELLHLKIPKDSPVRVLVLTGGCEDWWNEAIPESCIAVHEISEMGMQTVEAWEQASMGDAETLSRFIRFGMEHAPAQRTALVLWGHGDGPTGGVCSDPLFYDDFLLPDELGSALRSALPQGDKLDAVIFDSCLMASIDFAQAISERAKYMVASQENTVGDGLRYDRWIGALIENPNMETEDWCCHAAQTYVENNDHGRFGELATMSVLNLEHAQATFNAVEMLSAALLNRLEADESAVLERRSRLKSYGEYEDEDPSDQIDALLAADVFSDIAPEACAEVRRSIEQMIVCNAVTGDMVGEANGLSLLMPYSVGAWSAQVQGWYQQTAEQSAYSALNVRLSQMAEARYNAAQGTIGEIGSALQELWSGVKIAMSIIEDIAAPENPADMWEGLLK